MKKENKEINPAKSLLEKDKIFMSDKSYPQFKENLNLTKLQGINAIKQKRKDIQKKIYLQQSITQMGPLMM
jgi:hypothetical protein